MRTFLRFLERNKLYTFINVFGLSISLAFVILIAVFTERQMLTDEFQQNKDRIYLLQCWKEQCSNAYFLPRYVAQKFPEVEYAISINAEKLKLKVDEVTTQEEVIMADSAFFNMFTTETVEGDVSQFALSDHNCVISQSYARKMFGDKSPLGKTVTLTDEVEVKHTVVAVIRDIENSILPNAALLVRGEILTRTNSANNERMQNAGSAYTFIMTKENADITARINDITAYFKEIYWPFKYYADESKVELKPLQSLYFDEAWGIDGLCSGNAKMMRVLDIVALVLLIFAILNYINLTTAQATFRAKEMAVRQLHGTKRWKVILRLIGESVAMCAGSFIIALIIAESLAPYASQMVNYPLSVIHGLTLNLTAILVATILVIGAVAGIVPAMIISSYKPLDVMRGELRGKVNSVYGYAMIGLQYTIVCVMLIGCGLFYRQIRGMIEAPLGYNTADMILMPTDFSEKTIVALRDRLKQEPWVEKFGYSCGHPYTMLNNSTMQTEDGKTLAFRLLVCDSVAFDILGIRKLHDNNIASKDDNSTSYEYFTESTYRIAGIRKNSTDPIIFLGGGKIVSLGTFSDFHYQTVLDTDNPPVLVSYIDAYKLRPFPWHMLIKTTGDHAQNMKRLGEIYKEITGGMPMNEETKYVEDIIDESYSKQQQILTIVLVFSVVSILVATLGLLAMSTIYIRGRRRSIAIRRVFGTAPKKIYLSLLRPFTIVVAVSYAVACPIAYKLITWWLETYTFRVPQAWWIYALVGIAALVLAIATVTALAVKAARSNPIDCLRE